MRYGMSTSIEYIQYVCDQISGIGAVRYKKMFGEYMVYINEKPILLVCDNTVYVKILECIDNKMMEAQKGFPYNGAREHYILDIDNVAFSKEIISRLLPVITFPKPKKKK